MVFTKALSDKDKLRTSQAESIKRRPAITERDPFLEVSSDDEFEPLVIPPPKPVDEDAIVSALAEVEAQRDSLTFPSPIFSRADSASHPRLGEEGGENKQGGLDDMSANHRGRPAKSSHRHPKVKRGKKGSKRSMPKRKNLQHLLDEASLAPRASAHSLANCRRFSCPRQKTGQGKAEEDTASTTKERNAASAVTKERTPPPTSLIKERTLPSPNAVTKEQMSSSPSASMKDRTPPSANAPTQDLPVAESKNDASPTIARMRKKQQMYKVQVQEVFRSMDLESCGMVERDIFLRAISTFYGGQAEGKEISTFFTSEHEGWISVPSPALSETELHPNCSIDVS